ncbi:NAD(P)-dependent oxidoreductase [Actinomadura algeriensis]|uniref:3-hydroxyisobutyrate dehydrogenase n=1 Tax=Actinomadura algeriensis TaxID=1679523 RepID=A0ABR9JYF1_9ACTN|nr:NAD(P)-dependent oxidoreductase [Actinomadura algeriensis]MBE1535483.1 3-hydroxyisobutyrate dehydrogenase [Actinomadura algeriensis]
MSDRAPIRTVGFVGLGHMGRPMSRRLAEAGLRVLGHDPAPPPADRLPAGLELVGSPADAARGAGAVVLMLPNSDIVEGVVDGLLDALEAGSALIDMGSSRPLSTRKVADRAAERGVAFVDAPVSGGVKGAENGTLTIMAGGAAADVERVRPVLDVLGGAVVHAGDVGAGHALKAFNNLLSASHLLATAEVMRAGSRFGLDPAVMIDAINRSSGRCASTEVKWPNFVLNERYDSGFGLSLMLKDMRIAAELAEAQGAPLAFGRAAVDLWAAAAEDLGPDADQTDIARWSGR